MLTRSNIICCVLSILLAGYLVVALITSGGMSATASAPSVSPVKISVEGEDSTSFVTRKEVALLIKDYFETSRIVPENVPAYDIEERLNSVDNIERARCTRRSNDRLWVEVVPMRPVARIFDGTGSYYINREGKRLTASLRYRSDVPFITGKLEGRHTAARLMPLLDYIESSKARRELVTAITLEANGDVTLIPAFRGHVINFGAPDVDIVNKFDRLTTMYRDIMPAKGWDYYDTLSVKFRGQVVASRRKPRLRDPLLVLDPDGDASDNEDISTMTVDNN
ncbi:MAG: cell division protein FtsQ/DivIB [Muribaculaceae bacterium]|nr:cell division protein FtsQ/DivIB [Muribaculaceae bacterium]